WGLLILVGLLVTARYEGLFLAAAVGLLFALRAGWLAATPVAVAAALPVLAYAVVSTAHGWHAVPNSILLKGAPMPILRTIVEHGLASVEGVGAAAHLLGYGAYAKLVAAPHVLFLVLAALVVFLRGPSHPPAPWTPGRVFAALFVGTALVHMQFADTDSLFRYDAYLVGLGLYALARVLPEGPPGRPSAPARGAALTLAFLAACALAGRAADATLKAPRAMRNIYEQQYQMGLFLREYYPGARVVAHDVGAINYLADLECLDVVGLASREVFDLKLQGAFDTEAIARLSSGFDLAVLYDGHLGRRGGIPAGWVKVGSWTIPDNVICSEDTVSFYATEASRAGELASRLRLFGARLPADVRQETASPGAAGS
ncbi:MAG TPA: hypothetical protein VN898_04520, partial [Candidatus Binatia bacterium]|nr:hypothetical protein [Candidatus Binatia bacterium]